MHCSPFVEWKFDNAMVTMAAVSSLLATMPSQISLPVASQKAARINKAPLRAMASSKREGVDSIAAVTAAEGQNASTRRALMLLGLTTAASTLSSHSAGPASAALSPPCELIETPSGLLFCDSLAGEGDEAQSGLLIKVGRQETFEALFRIMRIDPWTGIAVDRSIDGN